MNNFTDAMAYLAEKFGEKDSLIGISTISLEKSEEGLAKPVVRFVDAYYQDGAFYTVTNAKSNKIQQIEQNPHVGICYVVETFTGEGYGENLGWVKEEKNKNLAKKLREIFAEWYEKANDDNNPDTCILKITLEKGLWNYPHEGKCTFIDFKEKTIHKKG